jgi:dienelactone hydrolase
MIDVRITVDRQRIAGKLLTPAIPTTQHPAVLFVHGWGGSQRRDIAKAKPLTHLGYTCLTFNLRGHARTRRQIDTVTRAQNLRDVLAGYDFLVRQPGLDPEKIAVVGTSYGGYLAALLTTERSVRWLALRAPALYKDADFDRPKRELNLDAGLSAYRRLPLSESENRALSAASRFTGDVLIVESEQDALIPHQVIENYLRAFARSARSVTHRILRGADHGLDRSASRRRYRKILEEWFRSIMSTKTEAQPAAEQQGIAGR